MDAIVLVLSNFLDELIWFEIALVSLLSGYYSYVYLVRKHQKVEPEWVPGAVVKDYLDRVDQQEAQVRFQLFGIKSATQAAGLTTMTAVSVDSPEIQAKLKELEAMRAQLRTADDRVKEFDKTVGGLKSEKDALLKAKQELEEKLKTAGSATAAPAASDNTAAQKEIEDLKARLNEYSVIEDDLASLKKFKQENEELRKKLGIKPDEVVPVAKAAEVAPEAKKEEPKKEEPKKAEVKKEEAKKEEPKKEEAKKEEPKKEEPKKEEKLAEVKELKPTKEDKPADPAKAAAPANGEAKKDEDLLSEFERMLAS